MYSDLTNLCVPSGSSILDAITRMEISKLGIVLVVNDERKLVGTITDGDIRRAMLARTGLQQPVSVLQARKEGSRYAQPITAPAGVDHGVYLGLLQEHNILQLPILDEQARVVGLVSVEDFMPDRMLSLQAVVMAGGKGSRLRPLTDDIPKPMLPVGDRPLMEIIIQQLRDAGIRNVNVMTHHNQDKITEHFGDGRDFGVDIAYVNEDRPLGTAGALGLMKLPKVTTLVINGDILTQVDFRAMLSFHREHSADLTMAVRHYNFEVPYGVAECEGVAVQRVTEKPVLNFLVNAGIYLLEPQVYSFIPDGQPFDMPDLIQRLLDAGRPVISFPIHEYWLDIGQHEDYERARQYAKDKWRA